MTLPGRTTSRRCVPALLPGLLSTSIAWRSQDDFAFGAVARYIQIGGASAEDWDQAISDADRVYRGRMHNLCCDNCHSHVARALDASGAVGKGNNMVHLAMWMFFCGRYTTACRAVLVWLPFFFLIGCAIGFSLVSK